MQERITQHRDPFRHLRDGTVREFSDPIAQSCICTSWNSHTVVLNWFRKHKLFLSQLERNQIRLKLYFEISKILNTTSWIISSPVVGSYLSKTTYCFCTAWFFVASLRGKGRHGRLRFFQISSIFRSVLLTDRAIRDCVHTHHSQMRFNRVQTWQRRLLRRPPQTSRTR